ncbi:hypothetical protein C8J56DRAFT_1165689, partial [Mycena floridula]
MSYHHIPVKESYPDTVSMLCHDAQYVGSTFSRHPVGQIALVECPNTVPTSYWTSSSSPCGSALRYARHHIPISKQQNSSYAPAFALDEGARNGEHFHRFPRSLSVFRTEPPRPRMLPATLIPGVPDPIYGFLDSFRMLLPISYCLSYNHSPFCDGLGFSFHAKLWLFIDILFSNSMDGALKEIHCSEPEIIRATAELNIPALVGGILGGLVCLLVASVWIYCIRLRKRRRVPNLIATAYETTRSNGIRVFLARKANLPHQSTTQRRRFADKAVVEPAIPEAEIPQGSQCEEQETESESSVINVPEVSQDLAVALLAENIRLRVGLGNVGSEYGSFVCVWLAGRSCSSFPAIITFAI